MWLRQSLIYGDIWRPWKLVVWHGVFIEIITIFHNHMLRYKGWSGYLPNNDSQWIE